MIVKAMKHGVYINATTMEDYQSQLKAFARELIEDSRSELLGSPEVIADVVTSHDLLPVD